MEDMVSSRKSNAGLRKEAPAFGRAYAGRKVFVTGHTGFKGSWLSLWLQALEAKVSGLALPPPTQPSLFEVAHVAQGMESRIADLRDPRQVLAAAQAADPEIVLHLAAQPLVRLQHSRSGHQ